MFSKLDIPYIGETELSVKKPCTRTVKTSLEQLSKKQLELMCRSYTDESFSKKEEQVEYLCSAILSTCRHFFYYENHIVYELMLMLLSDVGNEGGRVNTELSIPENEDDEHECFWYMFNSGIVKNLMRHGYIFHHIEDEEEVYSIPVEVIREVLSEVDDKGKTPYGKWEDFESFSSCMLSAYGVLTVKDFAKLWKIVFPKITLSEDQIIEHMSFSSVITQEYKWYESQNAIADEFFSEEDTKYLIQDRSHHELYVPDSSKLKGWYEDYCNMADEYQMNYFEQYEVEHNNPFYIQIRQFLEKYREDDWDEILYYIMYYIKAGFKMTDALKYLEDDYSLFDSMKERDPENFIGIYQKLHNSTHLWINYGWTPTDLANQSRQEYIQNNPNIIPFPKELAGMNFQQIPKVGRNDPCPCGSGKKYKQSQGR